MQQADKKEIISRVWPDGDQPDDVEITEDEEGIKLKVSSMYRPPSLSFDILSKLSEMFGTININDDDRFGEGGCESCDYGSVYGFTLIIRDAVRKPWNEAI